MTAETRKQIAQLDRLGWYHSIELPDGQIIKGLQSIEQLRSRLAQFPIPEDLSGKRVLDIGAWDGWFSFEMERRGAQVVAVDLTERPQFLTARELLGSRVQYHKADIWRLSTRELGYFDIVLFLGVLYHLKHPLLALEKVCEFTTGIACVESYVIDDGSDPGAVPVMEFYETTELRGQFDNWIGPNSTCLTALCRTAGFARVRLESVINQRAHLTCHRKWPDAQPHGPGPFLTSVENSASGDRMFSKDGDDYVAFWFKSNQTAIQCDEAFPEIGPYGSRPVDLHQTGGDGWHLNCKLPPGLASGWHEARLRIGDGALSNSIRIGVDISEEDHRRRASDVSCTDVRIALVTDGKSWERYRVRVGVNSCVSLWISGLPDDVDRRDIQVRLNGTDYPATFLSEPDHEGLRQVNALLPPDLAPCDAVITLVVRDVESTGVNIKLDGADERT